MTNFQSIVGGAGWAFISLLLMFAALEPVTVNAGTPTVVSVA